MRILDLCCGVGGWSNIWRENGHFVTGIDIVKPADIIADIRTITMASNKWDIIFASPPCTEFSREFMPWHRTGKQPDMSIVAACFRIAAEINPRFFVLENVKGAIKWLGRPVVSHGSRFIWGKPPSGVVVPHWKCYGKWHVGPSPERARIRSMIPAPLALAYYERITGMTSKVDYVLSQGQSRPHHCHWPGCTEHIPPAMWGCRKHWFTIPHRLRSAIWREYKPGQEIDFSPSKEYLLVATAVQAWIKEYLAMQESGVVIKAQKKDKKAGCKPRWQHIQFRGLKKGTWFKAFKSQQTWWVKSGDMEAKSPNGLSSSQWEPTDGVWIDLNQGSIDHATI